MQPAGRTWRSPLSLLRFTCLLILTASVLLNSAANAQTDFTRIYGSGDQTIPTPTFVGALGQKDVTALQELIDYLKAANITAWKGMQATGTLTDGSGDTNQATLTILKGDHFRLDVQSPKGERSTPWGMSKSGVGETRTSQP